MAGLSSSRLLEELRCGNVEYVSEALPSAAVRFIFNPERRQVAMFQNDFRKLWANVPNDDLMR